MSARELCLKLLCRTERDAGYSNIALDLALKGSGLDGADKRFAAALYYGVLERKITLDAIISSLSNKPGDGLSLELREILRMGLYQILYMDSVPDHAAVDESVKLAGKLKNPAAKGFVNALLRSFLRGGKKLPKTGVKLKDLSIEYSAPEWIIKLWQEEYGEDRTLRILEESLKKAPNTAKFNTVYHSKEDIIDELRSDGVTAVKLDHLTDAYILENAGAVEELGAYRKGMLHIQDASCQLCADEVRARPGDVVLDICSAPGGKAFTVAELMGDKGRVMAFDLHKNRVGLIESGARRLGLKSIEARVNDGKRFDPGMPAADRILCDVPCSGLGVIRRKPEIKYRADPDPTGLSATQYAILSTSAGYLKPGGILIYSTCTLRKEENERVVERFLREHSDFEPKELKNFPGCMHTVFPGEFCGDGFFIAALTRRA